MERRELFGFLSSSVQKAGKHDAKRVVLRPPYYEDEDAFATGCRTCDGACAALCQEQIIVIGADKTPRLDFTDRGCTYCDACAEGCPEDVLSVDRRRLIDAVVVIDQARCLSWQGVMCFSCKEPCMDDAIDFKAMFMPEINDKCTSCGFCIGRCPADAIDIVKGV